MARQRGEGGGYCLAHRQSPRHGASVEVREQVMDPITILMSGLSAIGAAIGDRAIKDGYEALKALLVRKFGGTNPKLAERVDDYVQDPDTYAKPAEKALRDSGVAGDQEVVARLTELVKQADAVKPVPAALIGQLTAVLSNVAVVGRDVHGGLHFGAAPARKD